MKTSQLQSNHNRENVAPLQLHKFSAWIWIMLWMLSQNEPCNNTPKTPLKNKKGQQQGGAFLVLEVRSPACFKLSLP